MLKFLRILQIKGKPFIKSEKNKPLITTGKFASIYYIHKSRSPAFLYYTFIQL